MEAKSVLEEILSSYLIQRAEFPPAGSPVVRFYRTRESLFRFLHKRCRACHRPPNVLYYDSPGLGFVCDECHTRAMAKRIEVIRSGRQILDPSPPESLSREDLRVQMSDQEKIDDPGSLQNR